MERVSSLTTLCWMNTYPLRLRISYGESHYRKFDHEPPFVVCFTKHSEFVTRSRTIRHTAH